MRKLKRKMRLASTILSHTGSGRENCSYKRLNTLKICWKNWRWRSIKKLAIYWYLNKHKPQVKLERLSVKVWVVLMRSHSKLSRSMRTKRSFFCRAMIVHWQRIKSITSKKITEGTKGSSNLTPIQSTLSSSQMKIWRSNALLLTTTKHSSDITDFKNLIFHEIL